MPNEELNQGARSIVAPDATIERDAARYRWLRARGWTNPPLTVVRTGHLTLGSYCPTLDALDIEVDAGMADSATSGSQEHSGQA